MNLTHRLALELVVVFSHPAILARGSCPVKLDHLTILNPDRQTLKLVAEARAHERKVIGEADLLRASELRGETSEDRVADRLRQEGARAGAAEQSDIPARVHKLTRLDRRKLRPAAGAPRVTGAQVAEASADLSALEPEPPGAPVKEFAYEEEA